MENKNALTGEEIFTGKLRSLFTSYGYKQYKMSKFEEYSLYGGNMDFLVSDSVITFTDTDGKLMALKPDVTLSIVKNDDDDLRTVRKVSYTENVYRVSKGTGSFKEIMQCGAECIGDVDVQTVGEALTMASKALALTGWRYALEVSHLGFVRKAIEEATDDPILREKIAKCVGEKNVHGIDELCRGRVDKEAAKRIESLASVSGKIGVAAKKLREIGLDGEEEEYLAELESALSSLAGAGLEEAAVDLSATADPNYYNGVVFKGFVEGVPESVLSGGQYDRLMTKMGRRSRAVGFAVYVDALERILENTKEYDFDVMLVYGGAVSAEELSRKTEELRAKGLSVYACRTPSDKVKCRERVEI